jgi:hypothetical protein
MYILQTLVTLVLMIAALLAFLWIMPGTIMGIIFLIKYFSTKDKDEGNGYFKKILYGFVWILVLPVTFILYALLKLIMTLFGINVITGPIGL